MTTQPADDVKQLTDLVAGLQRQGFYGNLEIRMEAGHLTLVRKTENIKFNLFRTPRESAEYEPTKH